MSIPYETAEIVTSDFVEAPIAGRRRVLTRRTETGSDASLTFDANGRLEMLRLEEGQYWFSADFHPGLAPPVPEAP
jgi:hypothetical protein